MRPGRSFRARNGDNDDFACGGTGSAELRVRVVEADLLVADPGTYADLAAHRLAAVTVRALRASVVDAHRISPALRFPGMTQGRFVRSPGGGAGPARCGVLPPEDAILRSASALSAASVAPRSRQPLHPGPRTVAGMAPVCSPSRSTGTPLTSTSRTPMA